jgi:hypothetical protein
VRKKNGSPYSNQTGSPRGVIKSKRKIPSRYKPIVKVLVLVMLFAQTVGLGKTHALLLQLA